MSFVKDRAALLKKYPQYETVARQRGMREVHANFLDLVQDHFDEKAMVKVKKTSLKELARKMSICCGNENAAYNIEQSLDDKFYILDGPDGKSSRITRKFKKNALKPYIENRYWSMKTNMEFCIAAGMSYQDAKFFSANMMGMPWLYLRNLEHLIPDFCLRFSLGPESYKRITQNLQSLDSQYTEHETECTVFFAKNYQDFCNIIEEMKQQVPADELSADLLCAEFEEFAKQYHSYLFGNFRRAMMKIYDLIHYSGREHPYTEKYFGKDKLKKAVLAEYFAETTLPWETRRVPQEEKEETTLVSLFSSATDQVTSCRKRIDHYCKKGLSSPGTNYILMRSDLIRLLLMNGVCDIVRINKMLEEYSFFALDESLPFDFLVLSALLIGTGNDIKDDEIESDPYEALAAAANVFM